MDYGERASELDGHVLDRKQYKHDVARLSRVNHWREIFAILFQWAVIAGAVLLATSFGSWWSYLVAIVVIGTRQHALGVLLHEAAHYRVVRPKWLNDAVSDLLLAHPLMLSTTIYRQFHLRHHRFANTEKDPEMMLEGFDEEMSFPMTQWECFKTFLRDLLGIGRMSLGTLFVLSPVAALLKPLLPYQFRKREIVQYFLFLAVAIALVAFTGVWLNFVLLWLLPLQTVTALIFHIRSAAEHKCIENRNELSAARTTIPTAVERLLIAPCHVNYHLDHHLFPSVPFYNLPKLHALLLADGRYAGEAHVTRTYLGLREGLLGEVTAAKPDAARQEQG